MNKLSGIFIFTLLFLSFAEAGQTHVPDSGQTTEKKDGEAANKRLTRYDRTVFSETLSEVIKVINKEKRLVEAAPAFGRFFHAEPKIGAAKRLYFANEHVSTTLLRKNEGEDWSSARLSLNKDNFTITDFEQKDFDALNLIFERVFEDTYLSAALPDGKHLKEVTRLPCYKYRFSLKSNRKIKLDFFVYPEMMNKNELFPGNFNSVSVYKEE